MNGFWFGAFCGAAGATALYVWVPAVYAEVKLGLGSLFHGKDKTKAVPTVSVVPVAHPPAPPAA